MALAISCLRLCNKLPQTSRFKTINMSSIILRLCIENLKVAQLGGSGSRSTVRSQSSHF